MDLATSSIHSRPMRTRAHRPGSTARALCAQSRVGFSRPYAADKPGVAPQPSYVTPELRIPRPSPQRPSTRYFNLAEDWRNASVGSDVWSFGLDDGSPLPLQEDFVPSVSSARAAGLATDANHGAPFVLPLSSATEGGLSSPLELNPEGITRGSDAVLLAPGPAIGGSPLDTVRIEWKAPEAGALNSSLQVVMASDHLPFDRRAPVIWPRLRVTLTLHTANKLPIVLDTRLAGTHAPASVASPTEISHYVPRVEPGSRLALTASVHKEASAILAVRWAVSLLVDARKCPLSPYGVSSALDCLAVVLPGAKEALHGSECATSCRSGYHLRQAAQAAALASGGLKAMCSDGEWTGLPNCVADDERTRFDIDASDAVLSMAGRYMEPSGDGIRVVGQVEATRFNGVDINRMAAQLETLQLLVSDLQERLEVVEGP